MIYDCTTYLLTSALQAWSIDVARTERAFFIVRDRLLWNIILSRMVYVCPKISCCPHCSCLATLSSNNTNRLSCVYTSSHQTMHSLCIIPGADASMPSCKIPTHSMLEPNAPKRLRHHKFALPKLPPKNPYCIDPCPFIPLPCPCAPSNAAG